MKRKTIIQIAGEAWLGALLVAVFLTALAGLGGTDASLVSVFFVWWGVVASGRFIFELGRQKLADAFGRERARRIEWFLGGGLLAIVGAALLVATLTTDLDEWVYLTTGALGIAVVAGLLIVYRAQARARY